MNLAPLPITTANPDGKATCESTSQAVQLQRIVISGFSSFLVLFRHFVQLFEHDEVYLTMSPVLCSSDNRHQNCLPSVFATGKTQHCSGANSHPALNGAMGCLPGDRYGVDRSE